MKFYEYLESTHVSTNIDLQSAYSPYKQGKVQGIQSLVNFQRMLCKWAGLVVVVFSYLAVLTRIKRAPPTANELIETYKTHTADFLAQEMQDTGETKSGLV